MLTPFFIIGLGGLANLTNPQVLQAANLGLLGNGIGNTDLSSLVSNPLSQSSTSQQLAALAAQNSGSNLNSGNSITPFSRSTSNVGDTSYGHLNAQSSQNYGRFSQQVGKYNNY